ncbi:MAG: HAD family phosphatase [Lachnospiraceae bacterium]|nr:HAD family phosphatase [Lachnospiraceae bacterium]
MIRHIIFDIGNVLADFCWKEMLRDRGLEEDMIDRIGRASVDTPLWYEFDRGVWTAEELMQAFIEKDPEIEAQLHLAFDDVHGMVKIRDYAIDWVKELKDKGYHVWYLSNFSRKAEVECADSLAFLPYMDGGILSYREKLVKPDPAIYRLLLERYALTPEECVFIDDTAKNIDAARALGIRGIVFTGKTQAQAALRALGVA